MLGLSPIRLLIIVVVALIVLGPDKLPQFARQAGAAWKTLRGLQERIEGELRDAVPDLPRSADIARYARSPISLLNQLADRAAVEETTKKQEDESDDEHAARSEAAKEGFTPPAEPPEVLDVDRPPVAWGDPSLN